MLGAIIGDVVGSIYEFRNHRSKEFDIYDAGMSFTDDTVMTAAVAEWLMLTDRSMAKLEDSLVYWGEQYRGAGYGGRFYCWLFSPRALGYGDKRVPYNSFGNGSAMRVSAVGWMFDTLEETEEWAKRSAEITHNHPEGIKGAQATAAAIFMARTGATKEQIKAYVEQKYGYDLSRTCDEIRPVYRFNETCQGTVPEAIIAFLESTDFEDAIRTAVSLGGDSDTLACITGGIAEAYYREIPSWMVKGVWGKLDEDLKNVVCNFAKTAPYFLSFEGEDFPRISSDFIVELDEDEIFVFGSNLHGFHSGGAARAAMDKFGAEWGVGVGRTGQTYAIPTMHGGVDVIKPYVDEFVEYAKAHPELKFLVTRIGCGIAGFRDKDIAPLFAECVALENVFLPSKFWMVLKLDE
jgi:ADP-ribosylglycohydrolase